TYGGGIFLSTNNGTSWVSVNNGLTNVGIFSFVVVGTNLFVGTNGGLFLSTNNGTNWTSATSGLPNTGVWSLAVGGTNLFAGTNGGGVYRRALSEMITAVRTPSDDLPKDFRLQQNYST